MRKRSTLGTLAAATVLALSVGAPAEAGQKPRLQLDGQGTYSFDAAGTAVVTGVVTGTPFGGTYTATLAADDGTLPEPGVCEPGVATLRVDGTRDRYLELSAADDICGQWLQPPYVVTHVFTGRYTITSSSERRLVGTDGFYEVRLATENRGGVFAIDT